jgi:hypothetical protein
MPTSTALSVCGFWGELASPRMHSMLPSDIRRSTLRLAVAGVIVGLAIPLLPVFGEGGRLAFIFSQELPVRFLIFYLLRWWASASVAVVGIWFLKRDRAGLPGGVFLAWGSLWSSGPLGRSSSRHLTSAMAVRRDLGA